MFVCCTLVLYATDEPLRCVTIVNLGFQYFNKYQSLESTEKKA